ncbi:MAG: membrane protein insertase YidC [Bacteroidota bacterium]
MDQQQQQGLDRNTLVGIVLISVIMGVWMIFFAPQPPTPEQRQAIADSLAALQPDSLDDAQPVFVDPAIEGALAAPTDSAFAAATQGTAETVVVETETYIATISTKGGTLIGFELKEYDKAGAEGIPVDLVSNTDDGALGVVFAPPSGRIVDSRSLFFQTTAYTQDTIRVTDGAQQIAFDAPIGDGALRLAYTFEPEGHGVGFSVEEVNTNLLTRAGGYELVWDGGLPFDELDANDESINAGAYVRAGGEVEQIKLSKEPELNELITGTIEWTAVKNKYFVAAILPGDGLATEGAELDGQRVGEPGDVAFEDYYATRLLIPRAATGTPNPYTLYLGPVDLSMLNDYDASLYEVVDYGFGAFMTRPLAKYVVAPVFRLFGTFIPNYGIVIILFAILVKILLYPLTKSAYRSTAKMRDLQPEMTALKEKYPDDPQKQQEQMMRLYRDRGVNPLGGCLPLLLQYPIIIALWRFFQNSILIRQESFLWANDLSAPDPVLRLPFEIPFYGDFVAGFCAIMGVAMVIQMRIAAPPTTSGAQAKIFQIVVPLMIFVFFNRFASGLSLYYLMYNVLTAAQQKWINHQIELEKTDPKRIAAAQAKAQAKKKNAKPGFFARLQQRAEANMKEAQKQQRGNAKRRPAKRR